MRQTSPIFLLLLCLLTLGSVSGLSAQNCDFSKPSSRDASWHPDGKTLVFDSKRNGKPQNIFTINIETGETRQLTDSPYGDYYPFYSTDGSRIVYMVIHGDTTVVHVMNADGRENRALTSPSGFNADPDWHPDGTKIIFYSNREGHEDLYTMNDDGSNQKRIVNTPEVEENTPSWSPDGSKILYVGAANANADLYVMNSDGTNPVRLTDHPNSDRVPRWHPNGKSVIYYTRPTTAMAGSSQNSWRESELVLLELDSRKELKLTNNAWLDQSPSISPDGQWIAFTSCKTGNREVWIMKIDGTEPRQITFTE